MDFSPNVHAVILCGGAGTRLWPMSRKGFSKQFLSLGNDSRSLLQGSLDRLKNIAPPERRWLVTAAGQEEFTRSQMKERADRLVVEPFARNTGPAIALTAHTLLKEAPDSYMVVLSSDHVIQNVRSFEKTIQDALCLAEQGQFVTVGIQPSYPATGFGYIECGLPINREARILSPGQVSEMPSDAIGYSVRSFREKPTLKAAEQFLATGRYLWNAGIFVWKTQTFWDAFSHIQPDVANSLETTDPLKFKAAYQACEALPIDVAFLEQTSHLACVPARFDWNDVGSWAAVHECYEQDVNGNSLRGDVHVSDCRNTLVHSSGPFVAAVGLENLCVVATPDAVLVMPLKKAQEVKNVVSFLEQKNRENLL